MTGRERVKKSLCFSGLDRAPRDVWALPYITLFRKAELDQLMKRFPMDIGTSQLSPGWSEQVVQASARVGKYTNEWGSVWYVGEPGVIGEVKGPAIANIDALGHFQPPWHLVRKRDLSFINKICELSDQFMLSDVTARPFERLQFLRGTENLLMDLGELLQASRKSRMFSAGANRTLMRACLRLGNARSPSCSAAGLARDIQACLQGIY